MNRYKEGEWDTGCPPPNRGSKARQQSQKGRGRARVSLLLATLLSPQPLKQLQLWGWQAAAVPLGPAPQSSLWLCRPARWNMLWPHRPVWPTGAGCCCTAQPAGAAPARPETSSPGPPQIRWEGLGWDGESEGVPG